MEDKNPVYLEFNFSITPLQPASDILIAELGELEFESFVEKESGLSAYILKAAWVDQSIDELRVLSNTDFEIRWTQKEIEAQNWNAAWEENYEPIRVGEQCIVRASFHPKEKQTFDIQITPKMSFGTGHHETTYMMLQHILEIDVDGKTVLDMGCGTGVLGILAKMKGASSALLVDTDWWCYENALENVQLNQCKDCTVLQGDATLLTGKKFDVILANINKNVLLADIEQYAACLVNGGVLYLSGFYIDDLPDLTEACDQYNLKFKKNIEKNKWVAAKYVSSL